MNQPPRDNKSTGSCFWFVYIRTKYYLDYRFADQAEGIEMLHLEDGSTLLCGCIPDISALYGLILLMRDRAVELLSMELYQGIIPKEQEHGKEMKL